MIESTLHPLPRFRDVVWEQVRALGLGLRREALVLAVVLGIATVIIGGEIVAGGPGSDSDETFPTALISFLYPFAVWRSEKRFGPAFLWTLPVDRRRMALAKVLAGGVWLMAAMALFVAWVLTLTLIAGGSPAHQLMRLPFIATIAMYLVGSALVLGLRHPLRWLFGAAGVLLLMGRLSDRLSQPDDAEWRYVPGANDFFSAVQQAAAIFQTLPDLAQWAITTMLWLTTGAALLWAAVSRHGEHRRR